MVDLPEPEAPMIATNSPCSTERRDAVQRLDGAGAQRIALDQVTRLEDHRHRRQSRRMGLPDAVALATAC